MYGMIHRGLRQMVVDRLGEEAWKALEHGLGTGPQDMISAMVYDDGLTVSMVAAAADLLEMPMEECLKAFGRSWIRFAERGSFGAIMDFTGRDLPGFIANLDRMHQAVVAAMPEARVPSFALVRDVSGDLLVQYRSERDGLEALVIGLLEGLMDRFDIAGEVRQVTSTSNAVEFQLLYQPG